MAQPTPFAASGSGYVAIIAASRRIPLIVRTPHTLDCNSVPCCVQSQVFIKDRRDDADGQPRGFNGTNEQFYGAHHLGIFDESLPQDVETRFTYGGWGFGHSVMGSESQASGWEGKRIDGDTVFEIAVFRRMPILGANDRMLD